MSQFERWYWEPKSRLAGREINLGPVPSVCLLQAAKSGQSDGKAKRVTVSFAPHVTATVALLQNLAI